MSLRLLLQKPEFTLPSSLSAGSIILSDFDCPVILWLWIIGHYSRNYHYILLIRPGRNYSSETLKDLRAEPSYLLSSVALGHWWMRTVHAPSAAPTLCSRGSTIQTLDLGTVGWASPTASLEGQSQQGRWHRGLTVSRVACHPCKWGHGQNLKHGLTKEKAMLVSRALIFIVFLSPDDQRSICLS